MRLLGIVSYDGGAYQGWQRQPDEATVQGAIEKVLSLIFDTPITIHGSGRTDAGVHANGQAFHFDIEKKIDIDKIIVGINSLLPKDMRLLKLKKVKDEFHARYDAKWKRYVFLINNGGYSPFIRQYAQQIRAKLDMEAMRKAALLFIGTHNFQDFTTKEEDMENYVRSIHALKISKHQDMMRIEVRGNGFMTYMVRFIVGTLIAIGQGRENPEFITRHLDGSIRSNVSYKAEPQGLYLHHVGYR